MADKKEIIERLKKMKEEIDNREEGVIVESHEFYMLLLEHLDLNEAKEILLSNSDESNKLL